MATPLQFPMPPQQMMQEPEDERIPTPQEEAAVEGSEELAEMDLERDFPESLVNALRSIVDSVEKPEQPNREVIIRECKKLLSYWVGIQRIWWDASRNDYRFINDTDEESATTLDYRDDTLNSYRAYGEAVVAALGASTPKLLWAPSDADNPDDILKAKAYGKITEFIELLNNLPLQVLRMIYTLWNQHFCATYVYADVDGKYGSVLTPRYVEKSRIIHHKYCPECGEEISAGVDEEESSEPDDERFAEALGGEESVHGMMDPSSMGLEQCPACMSFVEPEEEDESESYEEFDGYDTDHKAKICVESYGPLNVKIPLIAKSEDKLPYLIFEDEIDVNIAKDLYPHVAEYIQPQTGEESFDRWARTTVDYNHAYPTQACTIRKIWLIPSAYNALGRQLKEIEQLKQLFPDGCCVTFIGRLFVEAFESKLTECWTVSRNPVAEYLHAMPLGRQVAPVQEIQTELLDLTLSTIEQGIPEMWADPGVVDFEKYRNKRKEPGLVNPIKKRNPGESLDKSFFETRTGSLGQEVPELQNWLSQRGEFLSSAMPAIWGGAQKGGSGTLGEYEQSRSMALQRLGIVWKIINDLYARTMDKATRLFEKHMLEDEKFAKQAGNTWLNVFIKKTEMSGSVGRVVSQSSDQFPVTADQITARVFEMLNMKDPQIQAWLFHPDNAAIISRAVGIPNLFVPGDTERNKQLVEIGKLIITSDQMYMDPYTQQMMPSVPIEPLLDDDPAHIAVTQAWAQSEVGQMYKENDPAAYANVIAHLQQHLNNMQMKMQQQAAAEAATQPVQETGEGV